METWQSCCYDFSWSRVRDQGVGCSQVKSNRSQRRRAGKQQRKGCTLNVPAEFPTIASALGSALDGQTIVIAARTYAVGDDTVAINLDDKSLTITGAVDEDGAPVVTIEGGVFEGVNTGGVILSGAAASGTVIENLRVTNVQGGLVIENQCAVACPGDRNGDGDVDGTDLAQLLAVWNSDDPTADIDGNGIVDAADQAQVLGYWGACAE